MTNELLVLPRHDVFPAGPQSLLGRIRPAWQTRGLIRRVERLLTVDPSSACQRLFNAAMRDLRDKVVHAGLDIATEAARQHKLPPIENAETVERYRTARLLDLAYHMGLLSRPEWRRLLRVYQIRGDLEHEDDEYEATPADCLYVFETCVDVVLSRDPIQILRLGDVKDVIEQAGPVTADQGLLHDFKHAPQLRQEEITKFLIGIALDGAKPDIVRQNALALLRCVGPLTQNAVKVALGSYYQDDVGRRPVDRARAVVLQAAGVFVYLKDAQRRTYFAALFAELSKIGTSWQSNEFHGEPLKNLGEAGGLSLCPMPLRAQIVEWMVLAYIGEPGGYGTFGRNRRVFYSNTAAHRILDLFKDARAAVRGEVMASEMSPKVKAAMRNSDVADRFRQLIRFVEREDGPSR